jgi:hypothetical protein
LKALLYGLWHYQERQPDIQKGSSALSTAPWEEVRALNSQMPTGKV